ncbi:MAG TPA: STAS/SEC14 domain-containing protein [Steroidobacteraceae bacterium]|nr:STAS/SEC14 domain-containing protein [Steroidobacteraceae bacterium]
MDGSAAAHAQVDDVDRWIRVLVVGEPTEEMVRKVNAEVLALTQAGRGPAVLLDARRMLPPPSQIAWLQRDLLWRLESIVRCAVVVADSRCAFLARIAFGDANYRIFYEDLEAAERWLAAG